MSQFIPENENEQKIKHEGQRELEYEPNLLNVIQNYFNPKPEAPPIVCDDDWFMNSVPLESKYAVACYCLNKEWARYAMEHDPSLEFVNTSNKREQENWHLENEWLG